MAAIAVPQKANGNTIKSQVIVAGI